MSNQPTPPPVRSMSIVERLQNSITKKPAEQTELVYSMNPADYDIGTKIGHGSSAIVYIATYKPLDKQVAFKVIDLDMFERNQIDELRVFWLIQREIQIMSLSKHPNLLPVHGSFVNGSKLYIVMPFLSAGSCLDIMKTAFKEGMEELVIATILVQVLNGLQYLHKSGLIHRDVKAGNLLVDSGGLVQLADFGVSSSLMEHGDRMTSRKTFVGTPCWMAPEVMEQSGYDYMADIWSFGITALELANGHAPYAKFPPMKVLMMTLQTDSPTLDREKRKNKYSKVFKDMIDLCLCKDPQKRPTCEKLLSHAFFKQAKPPKYLVTTMLSGLAAVTERHHREMPEENQVPESPKEEWDFEDSVKSKSAIVGFKEPSPDNLSPEESIDHVPVQATTAVKKSRFVVDSATSSASVLTTEVSDSQARPASPTSTVKSVAADSSEVRKGRFQVREAPSNSNPAINSTTSEMYSSPNASQVSLTEDSVSKTGRFEVNRLPSSQVTSPVLGASDGPKLPRKFTVSLDTDKRAELDMAREQLERQRSHSIDERQRNNSGDKGRIANSVTLINNPLILAPIPTVGSLQERYDTVCRQVELQRTLIQDLLMKD